MDGAVPPLLLHMPSGLAQEKNSFFTVFGDVAGSSDHCVMFWIRVSAFPGCCMSLYIGSSQDGRVSASEFFNIFSLK
jgi:hypothetical protein